jgi:DNA-directed RNA polymerase subunit RPC12/RpoP
VKYSGRGWCYLLEGLGKIDKDEFAKCEKAINDCRKIGLLPIDFTAEDQDETRRFAGIHEASNPTVLLENLRNDINDMLETLPIYTTDYWIDEKYYLMMCVEKGDLRNLFKPICDEYHIPIVSSKGWAPILLRYHIAKLCIKAEDRGLAPVLLLFYDHDPAGLKITNSFRKGLHDISRSVGWRPLGIIIERFGLNREEIEKYNLTWIENIKTGSGREARDPAYIREFGNRKCEANALFKNDETLKAAEKICRAAIEKYYGADALERFHEKEKKSKGKLNEVYDNPVWDDINESIETLIDSMTEQETEPQHNEEAPELEKEVEVEIFKKTPNNRFYCGRCTRCGKLFEYDESFINRLVRCRSCGTAMRLKKAHNGVAGGS